MTKKLTAAEATDACRKATESAYLDSAHPMVRSGVLTAVAELLQLASQSPAHARALAAAWRDFHGV